jgi:hypothetical protein
MVKRLTPKVWLAQWLRRLAWKLERGRKLVSVSCLTKLSPDTNSTRTCEEKGYHCWHLEPPFAPVSWNMERCCHCGARKNHEESPPFDPSRHGPHRESMGDYGQCRSCYGHFAAKKPNKQCDACLAKEVAA